MLTKFQLFGHKLLSLFRLCPVGDNMTIQTSSQMTSDFGIFNTLYELENTYPRVQVGTHEHVLSDKSGCLFPLRLFVFDTLAPLSEELQEKVSKKLKDQCLFVLTEQCADLIPQLLQAGAFDALLSPLKTNELGAKLRYYFGEHHQRYLLRTNPPFTLELTKKEQMLFDLLLTTPHGVSRNELMTLCWKGVVVHPKTLDVHLFNLRQKLESVGGTVRFQRGLWSIDLSKTSESAPPLDPSSQSV